ncbi:hypothetical protein ACFS5L_17895 [Streptomyces phyllanthi]|uniref:Uncharacterized protein n=1 Tax=Streptomyces phyllanthi TaxID=1803180 RepID=A0A5N8VYM9_9ACTN|nr:hypothetical protein [Streptomyces phyllanthi]MPY40049.1 hypothetical protein [Streptomyces phyllanthi]
MRETCSNGQPENNFFRPSRPGAYDRRRDTLPRTAAAAGRVPGTRVRPNPTAAHPRSGRHRTSAERGDGIP